MHKRRADSMIKELIAQGWEAELYKDYSGRFMFGEKTWAVVTNKSYTPRNLRRDNLGLDWVYY